MPLDAFTLNALSKELNDKLANGKIDKIYQPEKDEIVLSIRNYSTINLVISVNPNMPRMHITTQKKDNPIVAPSFCMHLRKYLTGSRIEKVYAVNHDRIIAIDVVAKNEMFDTEHLTLLSELTGRSGNIILLRNGKITDALRITGFEAHRQIMPGMIYEPPTKGDKLSIYDEGVNHLVDANGLISDETLLNYTSGFSSQSAIEISREYNTRSNISISLSELINSYNVPPKAPAVIYKNGVPRDYSLKVYQLYADRSSTVTSLSEAIDLCSMELDKNQRISERSKPLKNVLKNAIQRTEKKLNLNRAKLNDCQGADKYKLYGDLLISNIYRIPKGINGIKLENFYDNMNQLEIPLDSKYSAQQNAQNYYKKYTKLKRSEETVLKMILENEQDYLYYKEISDELNSCNTVAEIADIEAELISLGLIRETQKSRKSNLKSLPLHYRFHNSDIYVGKNNYQNDTLTFKSASPNDSWLHVQKIHGSHVIIKNPQPDNETIVFAAELAAYYSDGKSDTKVTVDYTKIRHVKRAPQKRMGLAHYVNYRSVVVEPLEHKEYLVK